MPNRLTRPRKFSERSWIWISLFLLAAGGSVAASYFGLRFLRDEKPGAGGPAFLLIAGLGSTALVFILLTFAYNIRKRAMQERLPGSMLAWLKSHVWLGMVASIAAVAHAVIFPMTTSITSGKVTLAALLLLVISGVLWRIVYRGVPPRVASTVGNLAIRDTNKNIVGLDIELEKIKVGKSNEFQRAVEALKADRKAKGLEAAESDPAWSQAKSKVAELHAERQRERKQKRLARILQGWKTIHLPLAAILLGSIAFHLYDVFNADRLTASPAEKQFASAEDCARCHSTIVDEWKLSMHRDAGTSTTTVAQSVFALSKFPEFKKICVNCHMPIGVKFSQKATFPLTDPGPGANPTSVQDEGVTCVVCHTMPHVPQEMAGASDKLALGKRTATSFGTMFGPPLEKPNQIPATVHDVKTGFMTSTVSASQVCATCHNVKADIDGDGIVNPQFAATANSQVDTDGDGQLDENELDISDGILQDLVLQTTYDEWEDYLFARGGQGASCVDCHMPAARPAPLIDNPPPGMKAAKRPRQQHQFVAVDYELNADYYNQKGMPKDGMAEALEHREALLALTGGVTVTTAPQPDGKLKATVSLKTFEGHSFPTGFAFARQFWFEVSARTASGKPVCLATAPNGMPSPCESGKIKTPVEELATCENEGPGLTRAAEAFGPKADLKVKLAAVAPAGSCDPWLVNFQKILSDGDKDGDGVFSEVAHQSLLANIVKLRVRAADGTVMKPIPSGGTASFDYLFEGAQAAGEPIEVKAVLRLRHLPPSFIKELRPYYPKGPKGITPEQLLENMTVVNVASNLPIKGPRTEPAAETFAGRASAAESKDDGGTEWPLFAIISGVLIAPAALMLDSQTRRKRKR